MDTKPALESSLVREFVAVAHSDLERTRALLEQEPGLVNASWDWGGGDFETALGSASHMGRPDIANYLLENGARLDLFAATMLGKYEIVKSVLVESAVAIEVQIKIQLRLRGARIFPDRHARVVLHVGDALQVIGAAISQRCKSPWSGAQFI